MTKPKRLGILYIDDALSDVVASVIGKTPRRDTMNKNFFEGQIVLGERAGTFVILTINGDTATIRGVHPHHEFKGAWSFDASPEMNWPLSWLVPA